MNRKQNSCPRCGSSKFQRSVMAESGTVQAHCETCGFSQSGRIKDGGVYAVDHECSGYGVIAYVCQGERITRPFEQPVSLEKAKRTFRSHFQSLQADVIPGSAEMTWYNADRRMVEQYRLGENGRFRLEKSSCREGSEPPKRWEEDFKLETTIETELMDEVRWMEEGSRWIPNMESKEILITAIPNPLEAAELSQIMGLDPDKTYENAMDGPKLILSYGGEHYNIAAITRLTLYETAKLWGSSLSRLPPLLLAQNLNNSLSVAKGQTLMLVRHEKVMSMHSSGSYCVMPISDLLAITKKVLSGFGEACFERAYHSNSYTSVLWSLPDAQGQLLAAYQKALEHAVSMNYALNFMPVVRFSASDTAHSAAMLRPMFMKPSGEVFSVSKGISGKHERKSAHTGQSFGLELYEREAGSIFSKFYESMDLIRKMAETEIYNPVNCVVGLFNWINRGQPVIPRRYADVVRERIELFTINTPVLSMHDIYLAMYSVVSIAKAHGISQTTELNMEEAITKILKLDWSAFDVGGTVAWGDRKGGG